MLLAWGIVLGMLAPALGQYAPPMPFPAILEPLPAVEPEAASPPGPPTTTQNWLKDGWPVAPAAYQPEEIPQGAFAADPTANSWGAVPETAATWDYHYEGKGRAYYLNDQRYEFTGQEATFGVEGVVSGGVGQQFGDWRYEANTEIFLNQPFDRNILVDAPIRESFRRNFEPDLFQISQFYLSARKGDFYAAGGRFVTPFGRFYYPQYTNNFSDGPFIRSEAIYNRETGALVQWDPGWLVVTGALTNGGPERDTNSSKAFIGRIGVDFGWLTAGASIKEQDGVSSEGNKQFNNHIGLDAMVRFGRWVVSGEVIRDEYGFRRPGFDPLDIFWGRSIYFRDQNQAFMDPITGTGYYVDVGYEGDRWNIHLNYGDYFPETIGVSLHDHDNHRGLVKVAYRPSENWEIYAFLLQENSVSLEYASKVRHGTVYAVGTQFLF